MLHVDRELFFFSVVLELARRDKTLRLKSSWLLSHSMAASPLRGDALEKKYN
jgi:hypothetical protein